VSLILFETALAIMILTRADLVHAALVAGAVFGVIAAVGLANALSTQRLTSEVGPGHGPT
jgi:hypothetical protein